MAKKESWHFDEGHEIAPGRTALSSLGGGKRYEAWLAWDDHMMCLVVAKLIRPDQVDDDTAIRALEREVDVARRLHHPGIMRLFDSVAEGPHPHLVLEHVEGPTLKSLFRYGSLELAQLLTVGADIASAIHYMAAEGVAHLDIKPSNIVIGSPARLIDLSLARTLEDAATLTRRVGTTNYMPPEQCLPGERGAPGAPSDVWGLGVSLFEGATGELPFTPGTKKAEDVEERYPQLIEEPAKDLLERLPTRFAETLLQCLSKDPDERPKPADIVDEFHELTSMLPRQRKI